MVIGSLHITDSSREINSPHMTSTQKQVLLRNALQGDELKNYSESGLGTNRSFTLN